MSHANEEAKIKHALIDLLHYDKEVTLEALSELTGFTTSTIQKHQTSIDIIVNKLKKVSKSPNFSPKG